MSLFDLREAEVPGFYSSKTITGKPGTGLTPEKSFEIFLKGCGASPVPFRNIGVGVGVVIVHKGKILASRRKAACKLGAVSLSMPGGHIEQDECLHDCVVRETLEETGLIVVPVLINGLTYVLYADEWFREKTHYWTLYVAAKVAGGELRNLEKDKHEDWSWWTLRELKGVLKDTDWIPVKPLEFYAEQIGLLL